MSFHNKIEFNKINFLKFGNMVQYELNPYTIYDMDDKLIYLNSIELKSIGIPESEIRPILITDLVMDACDFSIESEPEKIFVGAKLIEVRTDYTLRQNKFNIEFKISIVVDHSEPDPFLAKTFDKIDKGEEKVRYLHQVQNIFKHFYNFELITIE